MVSTNERAARPAQVRPRSGSGPAQVRLRSGSGPARSGIRRHFLPLKSRPRGADILKCRGKHGATNEHHHISGAKHLRRAAADVMSERPCRFFRDPRPRNDRGPGTCRGLYRCIAQPVRRSRPWRGRGTRASRPPPPRPPRPRRRARTRRAGSSPRADPRCSAGSLA